MNRTKEQQRHLEELYEEILNVPSLASCLYHNAETGCYCVIGHMANKVGVIDVLTKDSKSNEDCILNFSEDDLKPILDYYGLKVLELDFLETVNDNYMHDEGNKGDVLLAIKDLIRFEDVSDTNYKLR